MTERLREKTYSIKTIFLLVKTYFTSWQQAKKRIIVIEIKNFVSLIKTKIMDLESRKISFVQEFLRLQNEEIVSGLEKMLRKRKTELIEKNLKPMSMEQYNDEIDSALDDSKNGRLIKATDLKNKIKKWN